MVNSIEQSNKDVSIRVGDVHKLGCGCVQLPYSEENAGPCMVMVLEFDIVELSLFPNMIYYYL